MVDGSGIRKTEDKAKAEMKFNNQELIIAKNDELKIRRKI